MSAGARIGAFAGAALSLLGTRAAAGAGPGAAGQPPARPAAVALIAPRCERAGLDVEAFTRLLRIELLADGVAELRAVEAPPRGAAPSLAAIAIEGGCAGEAVVTVVIDDAATDKSVRRALSLAELPAVARPRALALAAAELLRASWAELALPDAPPPRAPVPEAVRAATTSRLARATTPPTAPESAGPRWLVSAGADGRWFFGPRVGALGGRAGASLRVHGPLHLRAALGGWMGRARDPLGRIDLALATFALGAAFSVLPRRDLRLDLGADLELGWAHAGGEPTLATTAIVGGSTWAALTSVSAAPRVRIAGPLWASADVRFGAVLHGLTATADGRASTGLSGAVGSAHLGLAIEL